MNMNIINVGDSGLKVSRLGFGAMGFGDKSWRGWVLDEAQSRPLVRRALDNGINFVDTCDFYSSGASETILGRTVFCTHTTLQCCSQP